MKTLPFSFYHLICIIIIGQSTFYAQKDSTSQHIYSYKPEYRKANTLSIDIIHTTLYVKPIWENSTLIGKAEITLKPYFYPTQNIYFNARGMELKSIKISEPKTKNNIPFSYKYENDSIKILLNKKISSAETLLVTIDYIAQPEKISTSGSAAIQSDKGLYFINPLGKIPGKMPQIWTQGETQSNSVWFPTIDSPNEKMTHDIYITVDKKYTTLSNGLLTETIQNADGTKTDHWKMNLPNSPYLVMMGIGQFKKITDTPWKGKEISYYVEPEYEPYAKAIFHNTYKMIDFFSNKLGVDFAWQKYGQIIVRDYVSGAMENTSATLHGEFLYQTNRDTIGGVKFEDVISHELFHQWFGDLVTCESWSNLPLNESFATYGEYLWKEYYNGRDAADEHHYFSGQGYLKGYSSPEKSFPLIRYFYENREDMFDGISYNKGGQVLHMLRKYVGDSAFFQSLKLYLHQNKFNPVEIHHLRLAFEKTTGKDLNWFFNQWFFYGGQPTLDVQKHYDENTKILTLSITQTQPTEFPIYRLPLYIDIYTTQSVQRKWIDIQQAKQTFTFSVNENPMLVNFDAERQLLAFINYNKTDEEYIYQFNHAPLWLDRYEAIDNLKNKTNEDKILNFFMHSALKDKYFNIRAKTIDILKNKISSNEELKNIIVQMAQKDPSAKVRATALEALSSLNNNEIKNLYITALNKENSSDIISAALKALHQLDKNSALQYADKFSEDKSKSIISSILTIYAESGADKNWNYFKQHLTTFTGFETFIYMALLNKYLKANTNHQIAIDAANMLLNYYNYSDKMLKFSIKKILNDLVKTWTERENNLKNQLQQNNTPAIQEQLQKTSETLNQLKSIIINL